MNVSFYVNPVPSMTNPPMVPDAEIFVVSDDQRIQEALEIIQERGVGHE